MICKKCGNSLKDGWKYCPNCSKKIYTKKEKILNIVIILIIAIFVVVLTLKYVIPVNEWYIERELEKKYNENFTEISLINQVKNSDTNLTCDGNSFGTIKGQGSTKYYKVYSRKNKIEFIATYDTSDKSKTINDYYLNSLNKRNSLTEAYNAIYKYLDTIDYEIKLVGLNNEVTINSRNHLENILSEYDEANEGLDDIEIYINKDLYDFYDSNYETIINLNTKIANIKETNGYIFSVKFLLNSNITIEFDSTNNRIEVYDQFGNLTRWEDVLDKYLQ